MVENDSVKIETEDEQQAIEFAAEMKRILIEVVIEKNIDGQQFVNSDFMEVAFTQDIIDKYNLTSSMLHVISLIREDMLDDENV